MKRRVYSLILGLFCVFAFTSCSDKMGYSIVLWSVPEHNLNDGDVVPVYIKSNISQVYVIGTEGSDEKFEIPLWQLTEPTSKGKAQKAFETTFSEYQHQYARVKLDGLPVRESPDNIAKQVYRLRKDEVIKVLYKGEGSPVGSGGNALEGDWLRVLTSDGTMGWCFSYNLDLFDIRDRVEESTTILTGTDEKDVLLETVLSKTWYHESYLKMIRDEIFNLAELEKKYSFDTGAVSGTVNLHAPNGLDYQGAYQGVTKTGQNYVFTGTPLSMTIRNENNIVIYYSDNLGKRTAVNFTVIEEGLDEYIQKERDRRAFLFSELMVLGPSYKSSSYGTLTFGENNTFFWEGFNLLQPSVLPSSFGNSGTVSFEYYLGSSLSDRYDGVITFYSNTGGKGVSFLFQLEQGGLRLEDTSGARFDDNVVVSRSSSPIVIFLSN